MNQYSGKGQTVRGLALLLLKGDFSVPEHFRLRRLFIFFNEEPVTDGEELVICAEGLGEADAGTGDRKEDFSVRTAGSLRCEVLGVD